MSTDEAVVRLGKCERQIRNLRVGGLIVVVLASAIVAIGQAAPTKKVVQAEEFVLVDAGGSTRGWFGVRSSGVAEFWISDGKEGGPRARVSVSSGGGASMGVCGPDWRPRVELVSKSDGSYTGLEVQDRSVGLRTILGILSDGTPQLYLIGKRPEAGVEIIVPSDGGTRLTIKDKDGKVVVSLPQ